MLVGRGIHNAVSGNQVSHGIQKHLQDESRQYYFTLVTKQVIDSHAAIDCIKEVAEDTTEFSSVI